MEHIVFSETGILVISLWALALIGYIPAMHRVTKFVLSTIPLLVGWGVLAAFLINLWRDLGHPPMQSVSQTMLWAAFFLPLIALGIEWGGKTRIHMLPALAVGITFVIGVMAMGVEPNRMLPPALQSPWFAPHVLVYMLSYAAIAIASLLALVYLLVSIGRKLDENSDPVNVTRTLMRIAYPLLTAGMLLGAYWGKIAWGTYWGWDSKETAAFISWTSMLVFAHLDYRTKLSPRWTLGLTLITGLMIVFAWMLINLLPSASGGLHVYSQNAR